jgi:hypothetical protein
MGDISIYDQIYNFCKVNNSGTSLENPSNELPPRVNFIIYLLNKLDIKYTVDRFKIEYSFFRKLTYGYNIIMKGNSDKMLIAHHDIANPSVDNANDNSASVINAIALKKMMPNVNVVLTDCEEVGGLGAKRLAELINMNYFGSIKWVLNMELTGKGGKYFFIGINDGYLQSYIKSLFKDRQSMRTPFNDSYLQSYIKSLFKDCQSMRTPFNDSHVLNRYNIASVVINTLPIIEGDKIGFIKYGDVYLDTSIISHCHSSRDSLDNISPEDMKEFVESVLVKIFS